MTSLYTRGGVFLAKGQNATLQLSTKVEPAPKPTEPAKPTEPGKPPEPAAKVDGFPAIFKEVFKGILPGGRYAASPILSSLSDDEICGLFTPEQQKAIKGFSETKRIPDHLFHGKCGAATLQQRIVMSGVILATGRLEHGRHGDEPSNGVGKPRASCCGHFAHWIWTYAGANPAGSSPQVNQCYVGSVSGANGAIFFGGAKYDWVPFNRPSGNHTLQAGDWLYICYKKADGSHFTSIGDHSVIFSHWKSPGHGVFFSQRINSNKYESWSPGGGGDMHSNSVFTGGADADYYVSQIYRPDTSTFDILRTVKLADAAKQNGAWMKKNSLDPAKALARLAGQARERLKLLSERQPLSDFLPAADSPGKKPNLDRRFGNMVCLPLEEAFKPLDPAQQELIKDLIAEAEKQSGGGDETLQAVTKLYALNQRLRPRWDSDCQGTEINVNGLLEKDFTWYPGGRKNVTWELLGYPDKKAAVAELW